MQLLRLAFKTKGFGTPVLAFFAKSPLDENNNRVSLEKKIDENTDIS